MDSLIAIKGKDFVIVAADTTNAYSVLRMKVTPSSFRTTTTRFGTLMERSCSPSEENTPTSSSSETTSRKIWPSWSIKTATDSPLTILRSSFAPNWQRLFARDPIASTAFSLDSRENSPDSTGSTILDQWSRLARRAMDMPSTWPHPWWMPYRPASWLRRKDSRSWTSAWTLWGTGSWSASLLSASRWYARRVLEWSVKLPNPKELFDCWISQSF